MSQITDQFVIICFGEAEYPQDDPLLGTYWMSALCPLGQCGQLDDAMVLAERSVSRKEFGPIDRPNAQNFLPERIIIQDSRERLVLSGRVVQKAIDWCTPVTSDEEEEYLLEQAADLWYDASNGAGWGNDSTAEDLRARAALVEARLVDPIWRSKAAKALQSHVNEQATI